MMTLRRITLVGAAAACAGCAADRSTIPFSGLDVTPPSPAVTAVNHAVADGTGRLALQVVASLRNPGGVHLKVDVGPQCPLRVRMFPDSIPWGAGPADGCPASSATFDLAPGDSTTLEHTISADSLATMPAGTYGISVAVTTGAIITVVFGGTVRLPLTASH